MGNRSRESEFSPEQGVLASRTSNSDSGAAAALTQEAAVSKVVRNTHFMGSDVKINGQIFSKEDLYIDGEVEGTVELDNNRLVVGQHAVVKARITAREIVVFGTVKGNVEALDKIEIKKDARLIGDVTTARIVIEDGAYFKGSIEICGENDRQKIVAMDSKEAHRLDALAEADISARRYREHDSEMEQRLLKRGRDAVLPQHQHSLIKH